MNVSIGKSYHIKDDFYNLIKDPKLMSNKENNRYRPHFFFFADPKVSGIYWAVPQSSKVDKYRKIMNDKIAKFGKCNTIVIGTFAGEDNAFLIQNMFPIIEKFVDHEHTINGIGVKIHKKLANDIISNAMQVLSMHNRGKSLIFPDVDKIYSMMKDELKK